MRDHSARSVYATGLGTTCAEAHNIGKIGLFDASATRAKLCPILATAYKGEYFRKDFAFNSRFGPTTAAFGTVRVVGTDNTLAPPQLPRLLPNVDFFRIDPWRHAQRWDRLYRFLVGKSARAPPPAPLDPFTLICPAG
ncbi:unnamed protein product [Protopolystoma xenopodis]|uniref:Uncharacterized protein n=1 Tax=Protopolystoma xenopodis TaxID=117903 RepID=A0A448WCV2_9PLAT|nr:unnamed protein product [Protopolystoma xenopodis]